MGLPANKEQNEQLLHTLLTEIKAVIERQGISARITQAEALGSVNGHGINIKVVVENGTDAFENYRR